MKKLNFDELKDLIEVDPDKAEEYRIAIIQDFIARLPEEKQERMRATQWRLDQELRRIKNPIARMNFIYGKMMDSFLELDEKLQEAVAPGGLNEKLLDFSDKNSI